MAGIPWELKRPKVLGIHLKGKLQEWASAKDVILKLAGLMTVKGATNHVIEYFGPGVDHLSCTGMATICNMGAELGATTSLFPYNNAMGQYLSATNRDAWRISAEKALHDGYLRPDSDAQYDRIVEIDLDQIEPHVNGPFSPDASMTLSDFGKNAKDKKWNSTISSALIGSCTNSSYEDMTRAASLIKQALENGLQTKIPFYITPGSEKIRATMVKDGLVETFEQANGMLL